MMMVIMTMIIIIIVFITAPTPARVSGRYVGRAPLGYPQRPTLATHTRDPHYYMHDNNNSSCNHMYNANNIMYY